MLPALLTDLRTKDPNAAPRQAGFLWALALRAVWPLAGESHSAAPFVPWHGPGNITPRPWETSIGWSSASTPSFIVGLYL